MEGEGKEEKSEKERRELRPDGKFTPTTVQPYIVAYIVDNCTHKIMVTPSLIPVSCGKSLGTRLSHI